MYQALYRKYRPNTFEDVVGQEVIIKTLRNEILHNKINHAYLFTGPRGTGKTSIAKLFSKIINCQKPYKTTPCNECVSCTQIINNQNTDIIEIDAASNNGVDEIRELRSKVNLVPSVSKYKIYIIDEVHMLTTGAFNALLKTLEEPPAHIIFILATTDPHKIPTTILSRCQRFDFKKIAQKEIVERLTTIIEKESINIETQALQEIARLSDGGMRDAISMLDQAISYSNNETNKIIANDIHDINGTIMQSELKEFIHNLLNNNLLEVLNFIDTCNDKGKNIIKVTEEIIIFLKNALLVKMIPSNYTSEEIEMYTQLDLINTQLLIDLINLLNNSIVDMKNANDPKLSLELVVIKYIDKNNSSIVNTKTSEKNDNKERIKKEEPPKPIIKEALIEAKNELLKQEQNIEKDVEKTSNINFPGNKLVDNLYKLKELRINNTLSTFNKKELLELKSYKDIIRELLLDSDYSEWASIILDGELKAVGNDNMIFVYDSNKNSDMFNTSILKIEETIAKALNRKVKVIATFKSEWDKIKKEFNSKAKKYEYIEETKEMQDCLKETKNIDLNELESLFGDIVEYK